MGLKIQVNQLYGMTEGLYYQCFSRVAPGGKVLGMEPTPEGYGKQQKFVTLKHDFRSRQQAPVWQDPPVEMHPFYDQYSCLVVQLFGLDIQYKPKPDHSAPGTITDLKGRSLTLDDESKIVGFAIVPLFEGNSVLTGTHHVPVFKGKPSAELLQQFTTNSAEVVLAQQTWNSRNKYASGSLSVTLWDGHFEKDEVPELPLYEYMLESVGKLTDYRKARNPTSGKLLSSFIVDNLEAKYKKQGATGPIYEKEEAFFSDLMQKTFYDIMENALMTAGYSPL